MVIFKADVRDLGRSGELVEVKEGYARNYLLPRGLAVTALLVTVWFVRGRLAARRPVPPVPEGSDVLT